VLADVTELENAITEFGNAKDDSCPFSVIVMLEFWTMILEPAFDTPLTLATALNQI
jgi:hypothetical protein